MDHGSNSLEWTQLQERYSNMVDIVLIIDGDNFASRDIRNNSLTNAISTRWVSKRYVPIIVFQFLTRRLHRHRF